MDEASPAWGAARTDDAMVHQAGAQASLPSSGAARMDEASPARGAARTDDAMDEESNEELQEMLDEIIEGDPVEQYILGMIARQEFEEENRDDELGGDGVARASNCHEFAVVLQKYPGIL
jgi:hypothetical protein